MKLHIDPEWLRRKIAEGPDLEDCACVFCGAMAGACPDYPNCPQGRQGEMTMTTTVKILIEGNKACEVKVEGQGSSDTPTTVKPGSFATKTISGEQFVSVKETGEFLS